MGCHIPDGSEPSPAVFLELRFAKQQDDQADGLNFLIFFAMIFADLGHHILVGALEHVLFSMIYQIYGIILPIDFHIFQDG